MLINMQITLGNKSKFPFFKVLLGKIHVDLWLERTVLWFDVKDIICKAIILKQSGALKAHK